MPLIVQAIENSVLKGLIFPFGGVPNQLFANATLAVGAMSFLTIGGKERLSRIEVFCDGIGR